MMKCYLSIPVTNNIIHFAGKLINQTNTSAIMFIAVLITIAKSWKQSRFPPMDEGINKMGSIHKMDII